ncbi:MAG: hypothetical protein AAF251_09615 [Pseudomonadota bacterium]
MSTAGLDAKTAPTADALIGYTGFVGSTLARQTRFAARFNSANIAESAGRSFGTVVCAAAPGSMLEANTAPEQDRAKIHALMDQLSAIRAERFILISSIAVLADFAGGDDEGTTAFQTDLAYGRHRRELEAFVEDRFADHLIVRLPALFGEGLRKNFLFDLMNPVPSMLKADRFADLTAALDTNLAGLVEDLYSPDAATGMLRLNRQGLAADVRRRALEEAMTELGFSATQFHNPQTTYQYYEMAGLWSDIGVALEHGLTHLHLVAQPLAAARIHGALTGRDMPETGARLHTEDMRTRHADLWGVEGPYQFSAGGTLDSLKAFYAEQKAPA